MTNLCPLCGLDGKMHEASCPIISLEHWRTFIQSRYLTLNLLLLSAGNSESLQKLKDYYASHGGGELEELRSTAETVVNIFTKIQQAMNDTIQQRQTASSTAGRPDQPPASTSPPKAARDSAPDAGGKGESPAPCKLDDLSSLRSKRMGLDKLFQIEIDRRS
jgi:hypothetical protein